MGEGHFGPPAAPSTSSSTQEPPACYQQAGGVPSPLVTHCRPINMMWSTAEDDGRGIALAIATAMARPTMQRPKVSATQSTLQHTTCASLPCCPPSQRRVFKFFLIYFFFNFLLCVGTCAIQCRNVHCQCRNVHAPVSEYVSPVSECAHPVSECAPFNNAGSQLLTTCRVSTWEGRDSY